MWNLGAEITSWFNWDAIAAVVTATAVVLALSQAMEATAAAGKRDKARIEALILIIQGARDLAIAVSGLEGDALLGAARRAIAIDPMALPIASLDVFPLHDLPSSEVLNALLSAKVSIDLFNKACHRIDETNGEIGAEGIKSQAARLEEIVAALQAERDGK